MSDIKLDSLEGITSLIKWAKEEGYVLNEYHETIAQRYTISTDGVCFARQLPL